VTVDVLAQSANLPLGESRNPIVPRPSAWSFHNLLGKLLATHGGTIHSFRSFPFRGEGRRCEIGATSPLTLASAKVGFPQNGRSLPSAATTSVAPQADIGRFPIQIAALQPPARSARARSSKSRTRLCQTRHEAMGPSGSTSKLLKRIFGRRPYRGFARLISPVYR
jgi:hypothetical protein